MTGPDDIAAECARTMWEADAASQQLGMELLEVGPGRAIMSMQIDRSKVNGLEVCHGGLIFTLADSAMAFACNGYDDMTFATSADMTWLAPGYLGDVLTATAVETARPGRSGVYDVTVTNQRNHTIALFRGRVRSTGRPLLGSVD